MFKYPLAAMASVLVLAAAPTQAQTTYNGAGFAIPDLSTNSSTITVADPGVVTNVTFTLNNLSHTFLSDLFGTLSHDGVTVTWLNRTGGSDDLGGTYTISDLGTTTLGSGVGNPRASGTYSALSGLSAFNGTSVSGAWTLTIADQVGADVGNLRSWDLSLSSIPGSVPEPATWAMMLIGFGAIGVSMRRRRSTVKAALAA